MTFEGGGGVYYEALLISRWIPNWSSRPRQLISDTASSIAARVSNPNYFLLIDMWTEVGGGGGGAAVGLIQSNQMESMWKNKTGLHRPDEPLPPAAAGRGGRGGRGD